MRFGCLALSTVLLSGCAWIGGNGGGQAAYQNPYGSAQATHGSYYGQGQAATYGAQSGCQIYSPAQAVPKGCNPANVTLATHGGGFPQQPNFGSGQYVSGGYGSHAADAKTHAAIRSSKKRRLKKPRLRGSLSLGIEKSVGGNYLDYSDFNVPNPATSYNPDDFAEGFIDGSAASGMITSTMYSATLENVLRPTISNDDVHSTPTQISGGLEFIATPNTTFFANGGYTYAQGESGATVLVNGQLERRVSVQNYDTDTGLPVGPTVTNIGFIPNQRVAEFSYAFTDLEKINLEAGVRHYFKPMLKGQSRATITPFAALSAGANHYNAQSFDVTQEQVFFQRAYDSQGEDTEFYSVNPGAVPTIDIYGSQWVPSAAITTGVEWQVTPKTALAFETGVRVEGGRKYSNGVRGDTNVAVPVTIRGSYNF